MERAGLAAPVAVFYAPDAYRAGASVTLGEDAAHHARVRRLEPGAPVRLVDGAGAVASGVLARIAKGHATVEVRAVDRQPELPGLHLLAPVADRERMLWLAEKSAELGLTSWRPVLWRRSRSVSPRGEGATFRERVEARMAAALTQCGGAWLPSTFPDATPERAVASVPAGGARWMLDPAGAPVLDAPAAEPLTVALGPEGGFDESERVLLLEGGFVPVALAGHVLRFETAGVAGLAVGRARLASLTSHRAAPVP